MSNFLVYYRTRQARRRHRESRSEENPDTQDSFDGIQLLRTPTGLGFGQWFLVATMTSIIGWSICTMHKT